MERAAQDGYITHRSKHEKIIMHQPSWSYASSIAQPSWRWSYQHEKSYTRWLHHAPINTRKNYHASTLMIIRIKHNPTILALFQLHLISRAQWSLAKFKTTLTIMINIRRCDQTSRWSLILTADIVPAVGSLPNFRPSRIFWSQLQSGMQKRSDQLRSQNIILYSFKSAPRDYVTYGSVLLKTKASVQHAKY